MTAAVQPRRVSNGHLDKREVLERLTPAHVEYIYDTIVGVGQSKAAGEWRKCPSPFHQDSRNNPGFNWHPATGRYRDHSKGEKGDIFDAVMRASGCRFPEALELVANVVGVPPAQQGGRTRASDGKRPGRIVATYDYTDERGELLYQCVRFDPKSFSQRRPARAGETTKDGYVWSLKGVRRVPYRLPDLLDVPADRTIFVCEGEKDVDRLWSLGIPATTNPMGAGKWTDELSHYLMDRHVAPLPDHDQAGASHAEAVARSLHGIAASVRIVALPGLPPKGDVSDWLDMGHTGQELHALVDSAPDWRPPAPIAGKRENEERSGGDTSFSRFHAKESAEPFPVDALPVVARRLVEAGAKALGVPADMIGVPLLSYTGAIIGNRVCIQLKQGWTQYPTLYAAVIADPGTGKSPADDIARAPLDALQAEAYAAYTTLLEQYEADFRTWENESKEQRGPRPEKPLLDHYFTTDATLEALGPIAARSPGVVMVRDELVGWVNSFDAYRSGKGGDRQKWLSMHDGAPLKIDRKSTETIFVLHPVICVSGGIQPDMLPELAVEAGRRDGFIERLRVAYPETTPAMWTEDAVSQQVIDAVTETYRNLRQAQEGTVRINREAKQTFITWHDENARLTAQATGLTRGIYAKLPNTVARLALILHGLDLAAGKRVSPVDLGAVPVNKPTMDAAIKLTEYFRAHAGRMLAHFGATGAPQVLTLGLRVVRILTDAGDWMARSEIGKQLGGHVKAELLDATLDELHQQGRAELRTQPTGGRPAEQWRIMPRENVET